jgi:hypothetical protein
MTTTAVAVGLQPFLELSSALTGFSAFRLQGTGQAESYLATVRSVVGDEPVAELLGRYRRIDAEAGDDDERHDRSLRAEIMSDERLGPIARNIIKLWFVSTWYQLPAAWRTTFGAAEADITFVVSPAAYTEGLLWPAVGANPPGAKAPGYASWAEPPQIPAVAPRRGHAGVRSGG